MAEESKQKSRVWLWIGAALLLVIVFFLARRLTRDRLPIRTATVVRTELIRTVTTNGLVEPAEKIEFHSPLATSVRAIHVQQGDHVKAGQLLMELDDAAARARVAAAESGLRSAQASDEAILHGGTLEERQALTSSIARDQLDVTQKQHDLDALIKLQSTGAASASEVDASRQRLTLAQDTLSADQGRQQTRYSPAERERASAAVADAQANLLVARKVLEQTSIRAPGDGTVYSILVGRSDFVEEGKLLLQMADLSRVRVRAYFDEPDIGRLAVGEKIRIVWDAYPGREWHGHISLTPSTVITSGTRNVGEALIAIDGADDVLLPDTHVTVTVDVSSSPNTLVVPREAMHSEGGRPYVYRVVNDALVRTSVTVGTANISQVPITSGLKEGEVVATISMNGLPLEEGQPVRVVQ